MEYQDQNVFQGQISLNVLHWNLLLKIKQMLKINWSLNKKHERTLRLKSGLTLKMLLNHGYE